MKRALLPLAALLLAAQFAAISIEPYGDSVYDLASGVTTLPQGGVIHDNENNLSIDASFIEYKEGEYIKAKKAKMETEKARFAAEELNYLPSNDEVKLSGGVSLDTTDIKNLKAKSAWIFLKENVAVATGGVTASKPELSAALLVADYRQGEVLLIAPYKYKDAKLGITLSGKNPKKPLYLKFDGDTGEVSASSKVPPEVAARLLAYVDRAQAEK
ncbi:hypothetical protein [Oceanithermus sp.]